MRVRNARDVGALIRGAREEQGWSQQALADRAEVSKRWLVAVEHGKAGAELALVLRTLAAVGLALDASPRVPSAGEVRLDQLIEELRPPAAPAPPLRSAGRTRR